MRNFFSQFFQGRYGSYGMDKLTRFLLILSVIALIVSLCSPFGILYYVAFALLIYSYFRLLSKNITKRYKENESFIKAEQKIRLFFGKKRNKIIQYRHYHIYTCPQCKQKIRIPRGAGNIMVRCPKCMTEFKKKA